MAVLLAGAVGLAQQRTGETRLLSLDLFSAETELRYETENREQTSKQDGSTTRYSTTRFHELLDLGFRGYLYHPRLLEFSGKVGFNIEQSQTSISTPGEQRSETWNGASPRYSITGAVLPQHPVSLSFGLDRNQSTVSSGVGDLAVVDTQSERANLHIKTNPFPIDLYYNHTRFRQDQLGFGESRDDETTTAGLTINHYSERSTSRLNFERSERAENITHVSDASNRYAVTQQVQSLSLSNHLRFGGSGMSSLSSQADYRDEAGSYPSTRLSLGEQLHLAHSDSLASNYQARYARDTIAGRQSDLVAGQASLVHQLYKSLTTTMEVHGSQQSFETSSRDVTGGSIALAYRKRIPRGTLLLDLGAGQDLTEEQGQGGVRAVVDESHVLTDGTTVFLDNPDVTASTAVVRNAANQLCFLDVDYRLIPQGRYTEIRRVFSSILIPDGGTVLVNYSYQAGAPMAFTTRNTHWRAQVDLFDRLSLYTGVRTTRGNLVSGTDAGRLQDLRDTLYGASFTWGPAKLRGEHEIYDSNLTPYTSNLLSLDISQPLSQRQHISANASLRRVDYGDGGKSSYDTLSGTYSVQPTPGASVQVTLGAEKFDDRGTSGTHLYGRLEASYRIRATQFALSCWFNERDDSQVKETTNSIIFSIRRNF